MLEMSYGQDEEDEYNTDPYLHFRNYKISNKLTSNPIYQLENCKDNKFLVRTSNSCDKVKIIDDFEGNDNFLEVLYRLNFSEEVYGALSNPFHPERSVQLLQGNQLCLYDEIKSEKI